MNNQRTSYGSKDKLSIVQWIRYIFRQHRAGRIGLAAPVLAGPVFSQGKSKIPFLQNASVILGLIRLIILSYNR